MRKFLLFFVALLLPFLKLSASHVMGSDITYKCISPWKFAVTIKIYRQCNGVPLQPIQTQVFCNTAGPINFNVTLDKIVDITPRCKGEPGPCNPPNTQIGELGIEEHTFLGVLDFNSSPFDAIKNSGCCEVKIAYSQCCRDGNTTTGAVDNFYADAMINICKAKCNNSPDFRNVPVGYVCCNQPYYFNNGVSDSLDFDSLSYSMVPPKTTATANFAYNAGFSATKPFTYYSAANPNYTAPNNNPPIGFYFDTENGDIIFTPTNCDEIGPMVIMVTEWRKDSTGTYQKIGETRRDMELIIRACPGNNPPRIHGPYSYSFCEGTRYCFPIRVTDDLFVLPPPQITPPPDTVFVDWDHGIPDASFTVIDPNAREKTVEFCWTPEVGMARNAPYTFSVTAVDNFCRPRPASSTRGFKVFVKERAKADRKYTLMPCGKVKFEATPTTTMSTVNLYNWTILDTLGMPTIGPSHVNKIVSNRQIDSFQFKKGGKYIIRLFVNNTVNCPHTYQEDTLIVPELLEVDLTLKDTFVCAGLPMTLNAKVKNGKPAYRYRWGTPAIGDTLSDYTLLPVGDTTVTIMVSDLQGCRVYDTAKVLYKPLPVIDLGPDKRQCYGDTLTLDAKNPGSHFKWSTGDTTPILKTGTAGNYWVTITDSFNCISRDTMKLDVNDPVVPDAGPDRKLCLHDTLYIEAKGAGSNGTSHYTWEQIAGSGLYTVKSDNRIKVYETTNARFVLHLSTEQSGVTCVKTDTVDVNILALPQLSGIDPPEHCYSAGVIDFNGTVTPMGGRYYYLKDSFSLMPDRRTVDPKDVVFNKYNDSTLTISYKYTDPNTGCSNWLDFHQTILRMPRVQVKDTFICEGTGNMNLRNIVVIPKVVVGVEKWKCLENEAAVTETASGSFLVNTPGTYTLVYHFTDGKGCDNYDTAVVLVKPLPVITMRPAGPYCADSSEVNLSFETEAKPAGGKWKCIEKPDLISGDNILVKKTPGMFTFVYTHDLTGCAVSKTISLQFFALPVVSASLPAGKETVCKTVAPFQVNGLPAGGVFSSPVNNLITAQGMLDPAAKPDDGQLTGTYFISYEYTDASTGCKNKANIPVKIQEPPVLEVTVPDPACEDVPFKPVAHLISYAPNGIRWTTAGTGIFTTNPGAPDPTYAPSKDDNDNGGVLLTVTTQPFGVCPQASKEVPLTIWPKPEGSFAADKLEGCSPLEVQFTLKVDKPATGVSYLWNLGDGSSSTQQNPSHAYNKEGKYTVSVLMTTDKGCTNTLEIKDYLSVYPVPFADFDIDPATHYRTVALPKFEFTNKSSVSTGKLTYAWDFGIITRDDDTSTQKDPVFMYSYNPKDTGDYDVLLRVTTDKGCTAEMIQTVHIGPDLTVFIPNAFSPNQFGPGSNNRFFVTAQGYSTFHINIFNRWGEKLYTSKKIEEGWDGNYGFKECQQDVYYYQVEIVSLSGKLYKYNGTVTLLR